MTHVLPKPISRKNSRKIKCNIPQLEGGRLDHGTAE